MVSTHLIGSSKSVTGRGWMKRRPARAKIIAVLLDTLMAILHSLNHRSILVLVTPEKRNKY